MAAARLMAAVAAVALAPASQTQAASPPIAKATAPVAAEYARFADEEARFTAHPGPIYRGPKAPLHFTGPNRPFATFRSRIRQGAQEGVNFAGDSNIVRFGCGAGCIDALVIDLPTGRVRDLGISGEDYMMLRFRFRSGSRYLKAFWVEPAQDGSDHAFCVAQGFVWNGQKLAQPSRRFRYSVPTEGDCPDFDL